MELSGRPAVEKTKKLTDYFIAPGNRVYLIGAQNGSFPDIGWHIEGEMGGIWDHPIKLMDGFWLKIRFPNGKERWLERADKFITGSGFTEHHYLWSEEKLRLTRKEFCPDEHQGAIIYLIIQNLSKEKKSLEVTFLGRTDLMPVWLSEEIDYPDEAEYDPLLLGIVGKDQGNPWYVLFGSDLNPIHHRIGYDLWGPEKTKGKGISGELLYTISLEAEEEKLLAFFVAGSFRSKEELRKTYLQLKKYHHMFLENKIKIYADLSEQTILECPDPKINGAFLWAKCNFKMLERKVPEIGKGLGAGVPHYPWWFGCDTAYSVPALLAVGQFELAKSTLKLLADFSKKVNKNGRIPHEVVTCGKIYNPGNTEETPLFVKAAYLTYLWTGDGNFLAEMYPLCKQGILDWTFKDRDVDRDLFPEGQGIMESPCMNLEMLDSACYAYESLLALQEMAKDMNDKTTMCRAAELATRLKEKVNREFWIKKENLFGDAIATPEEIKQTVNTLYQKWGKRNQKRENLELLQALIAQAKEIKSEKQQPWLFKQWILAVPMESGVAEDNKAVTAFERLESSEFTGRWGLKLIDRLYPEVMTLTTGVMAVAECKYGRIDKGLGYIKKIANTLMFAMPGALSEISPDKGCFLQAWSGYGIIWPIVTHIFGFQPDASKRLIRLTPDFPTNWDQSSLKNVRVGEDIFDIVINRGTTKIRVELTSSSRINYITKLGAYISPHTEIDGIWLNGRNLGKDEAEIRFEHGRKLIFVKIPISPLKKMRFELGFMR